MPLTNFKADLTSYLKKLAGVHAVGELWWHYDPKSKPAGVQLFSGQLISREAYPDHWTLVSTKRTVVTEEEWQTMVSTQGFCQFYSSGDGSTTYRMPLVRGVYPKFVAALAEAGQHIEAGLPNITGSQMSVTAYMSDGLGSSGALRTGNSVGNGYAGGDYGTYDLNFDASLSNPIYGNSNTVQPEALTMVVGEWVVGSVATLGEADAESLLASVTTLESNVTTLESNVGVLTTRVSNAEAIDAEGRLKIVGWGMPDYSAGITVSGVTTYTAPTAGLLIWYEGAGVVNGSRTKTLTVNGKFVGKFYHYSWSAETGSSIAVPVFVEKGDVVVFSTASTSSTIFYPLKGAL